MLQKDSNVDLDNLEKNLTLLSLHSEIRVIQHAL